MFITALASLDLYRQCENWGTYTVFHNLLNTLFSMLETKKIYIDIGFFRKYSLRMFNSFKKQKTIQLGNLQQND